MSNQTIESTLESLQIDLADVKARDAHTGCVYLAYKQHTLLSGIYKLQGLAKGAKTEFSECICNLLAQYHQLYSKTIHH
jgi:hypothetical protein